MEKHHCTIGFWHRIRQALLVSIAAGSLAPNVRAEDIRIKVLNGRNGHQVIDDCISVWVGSSPDNGIGAPTQKDGAVIVQLARDRPTISRPTRGVCNGLGAVNPVLQYGDTIRITSNYYMPCQPHPPNSPWLSFSTEKVLQSGEVSANYCGKIEASPKPGELIFFVRPLHWWEAFRR
jgi:hypothetical protein